MELTEKAKNNRDELFAYYESILDKTDPEYMEIIENFIFDESYSNSSLDNRSKMLVILSALIANQSTKLYEKFVEASLNVGVKAVEIKEVLYQSTAYLGLAKVYDFLNITNDVLAEKGIDLPLPGLSTTNRQNRHEKGLDVQIKYFGDEIINMRENAKKSQAHFNDFLSGYCFGDFYTRGALDDQDRELITFCFITSLGGCENQLRSHVNANLVVGNDEQILVSALSILVPFIGFPRTLNALAIVNEVCKNR